MLTAKKIPLILLFRQSGTYAMTAFVAYITALRQPLQKKRTLSEHFLIQKPKTHNEAYYETEVYYETA